MEIVWLGLGVLCVAGAVGTWMVRGEDARRLKVEALRVTCVVCDATALDRRADGYRCQRCHFDTSQASDPRLAPTLQVLSDLMRARTELRLARWRLVELEREHRLLALFTLRGRVGGGMTGEERSEVVNQAWNHVLEAQQLLKPHDGVLGGDFRMPVLDYSSLEGSHRILAAELRRVQNMMRTHRESLRHATAYR